MTIERTHPTDIELAEWVDEPETRSPGASTHIGGCGACRARVDELVAARVLIAFDPPLPSDDAFVAQRERILAAIGSARSPEGGVRIVRRIGWLAPLAAAAAIATFLVLARDEGPRTPAPDSRTAGVAESPGLPILVDAREAAEEAAAALVPAATADISILETALLPSEPIEDDVLDAALAAAEPLAPPASLELSMTIESRFADLAEEDQDAVLLELAAADLGF
ncbi:MAG TPA: hypothetical protein VIE68_06580 [Gemmatimonadota bacterium]|jgi:hypothetical protein